VSRWWADRFRWSGIDALFANGRSGAVDLRVDSTEPAALQAALDALALPRGSRLICTVGGGAARYRIVPWVDALGSAAQRQLLAQQCFVEAFGEAARSWTVRQHATRYGAATLACAIDTALLSRLAALTGERGLKLISVQPSLMRDFNASRRQLPPGMFWFAQIEPACTTLLLMSPTEPLHIKRLPSGGGELSLALALDREWFALGIDAPRCPVLVAQSAASSFAPPLAARSLMAAPGVQPPAPGWQFIGLPVSAPRGVAAAAADQVNHPERSIASRSPVSPAAERARQLRSAA
jgi:hypothetical protein